MNIRCVENFIGPQTKISQNSHAFSGSELWMFPEYLRALLLVKLAAAHTHQALGEIKKDEAHAIEVAVQFFLKTQILSQGTPFIADVFQGGGGIAVHMNINEVLALKVRELSKSSLSLEDWISKINRSQSTSDVCATAGRMAIWRLSQELLREISACSETLKNKSDEFAEHPFIARTCLQDAMPTDFGLFFGAWNRVFERCETHLSNRIDELLFINLGGTVFGSGEGASVEYRRSVVPNLVKLTGLRLAHREDLFDAAQHSDDLNRVFSELDSLSAILLKMAKDLRLLNSGPKRGFHDVVLPHVIKGSSFFAEKNNPTVPETLMQACFLNHGDYVSAKACLNHSELNLNVFEPMQVFCLYRSLERTGKILNHFNEFCLKGMKAL